MVKKVSLIGVEFDQTIKEENQLQSKWSHHPLGLMYLISSARKKYPDIVKFYTLSPVKMLEKMQKK